MIADDPGLLEILNSMEHLPRHNVLFAGVQYLMMGDDENILAAYYPNFAENPLEVGGIVRPFTDFVMTHADELVEIGRSRYTQTNECRRCVGLLPALWATGANRFHLIDFGTSAGLNLQLDRYRYRWGSMAWGPETSPVELVTEMRGGYPTQNDIEILSRTGIDLNPLNPSNPDDRRWLEALVWPEHHERRLRLRAALELAAAHPIDRVGGDGLATLPEVLEQIPRDEPAVVINSFILNQFSPEDRERYDEVIAAGRVQRPVYRVSMEWLDPSADSADLEVDDGTGLRRVGRSQPHGEWLELV